MNESLARLSTEVIGAEINLGAALVSVSQLAYRAGNSTVGKFAQKRAEAAWLRAVTLADDLPERDRQSTLKSVELLRLRVEWLSKLELGSVASSRPADVIETVDLHPSLETSK